MAGFDDEDDGRGDRELSELDDFRDRDELRERYYGLLQELRVLLPGVQVMLAFLLAVPFAPGFNDLDDVGRAMFGVAMLSSLLAVVCMVCPTALHRFGARTARRARLAWSIRMTMIGVAFLGSGLTASLWAVARHVYGTWPAVVAAVPVSIAIPALWWLLPRRLVQHGQWAGAADREAPDQEAGPQEEAAARSTRSSTASATDAASTSTSGEDSASPVNPKDTSPL